MSQDTTYIEAEAVAIGEPRPLARFGTELLGTFVLVLTIVGSAMYGVFGSLGPLGPALAGGLVLAAAAAGLGHISGGHFNPAVTLGAAIAGRTAWRDLLPYWVAQFVGAALASLVLFATAPTITDAAKTGGYKLDGGTPGFFFQKSANGFGSHSPVAAASSSGASAFTLTWVSALLMETVVTAIFVGVILAVTDRRANRRVAPLSIGFALTALIFVAAPLTNAGLNPARSFASALFGGGWTWSQLWVFLVAPLLGAAIAALLYRVFAVAPAHDDLLGEDEVYELNEEEVELPEEIDLSSESASAPQSQVTAPIDKLEPVPADIAEAKPDVTEAVAADFAKSDVTKPDTAPKA